jgi:hypothetical protein
MMKPSTLIFAVMFICIYLPYGAVSQQVCNGAGRCVYNGVDAVLTCSNAGDCYCASVETCNCVNTGNCYCGTSKTCNCLNKAGACFGASNNTVQTLDCTGRTGDCNCGTAQSCTCSNVGLCCHSASTTLEAGPSTGSTRQTTSGMCNAAAYAHISGFVVVLFILSIIRFL